MEVTDDLTPLGYEILEHWSKYRPRMVEALTAQNELLPAIFAAQELTSCATAGTPGMTGWCSRKAGGSSAANAYLCKLPEAPPDVMLFAVPRWMFDAASCATMPLADFPAVDRAALRDLGGILTELRAVVKTAGCRRRGTSANTEIPMALTPRDLRPIQPALFDPRLPLPQWHELDAMTHAEVVALLAQLLVWVQASASHHGDHNE